MKTQRGEGTIIITSATPIFDIVANAGVGGNEMEYKRMSMKYPKTVSTRLSVGGEVKGLVLAACMAGCLIGEANAQLRVVAWNISNYDGDDRAADLQRAVYDTFSGRRMAPDVILAQEFSSSFALATFLSLMNGASGSPGDWAAAPFVDGPDTESVCLYRTTRVSLVGGATRTIALGSSSTSNQPRHTYRYDLRLVGYNADSAVIAMYNVHLKSGDSGTDIARRLVETTRIRDNAQGVDTNFVGSGKPAAYQFLVAGDMNTQTDSQSAYAELVLSQSNNNGRFFDPIKTNGSWNNNAAFRFVHTQDPSGAGGMDDRHDQILLSGGLIDGAGLDYIGNSNIAYSTSTWNDPNHSYRAWGNDGTSYNLALTTTGNTMVGALIAQALKNAAAGGGHLPVFLDLRVPGKIAGPGSINFGDVAVGAVAEQSISVGNNGDVAKWTVAGISNITYTLGASSGFTAPAGSFNDAAGGILNSHTVTMNTSTPGVKTGTLTIISGDLDFPTLLIPFTGTVQAANLPPVANAGPDQTVTDIDGSGTEVASLDASASADPDGDIILYRWTLGQTQLASGTSPTANVVLPVGLNDVQLTVTDNRGASTIDTIRVTVNPRPNQPPTSDAGLDQSVVDIDRSGEEPVTLDGSASADLDGTIVSLEWFEGQTLIASGQMPVVSFSVGSHTVTLIVTDNNGGSASDDVTILVSTPCVGDFNQDGGVDGSDVEAFFEAWSIALPSSDVNSDGGVDGSDVEEFFTKWSASEC